MRMGVKASKTTVICFMWKVLFKSGQTRRVKIKFTW